MKHAIEQWTSVKKLIKGRTILLLLDFDGTLAPISSTPSGAHLPSKTKKLLKQLYSVPNIRLAIISGRDLDEIKKMVGVSGIVYAGNHGCSIAGPDFEWRYSFPPAMGRSLQKLYRQLSIAMKTIPGVILEKKAMSVAVHFRKVSRKNLDRFRETLVRISEPFLASSLVHPLLGKKVVEFNLATTWNKGKAAEWLLHRMEHKRGKNSCLPIVLGDDVTDEAAFLALRGRGVTVRVGRGRSAASFFLKDTSEVVVFLKKLFHHLK